MISVICLSKIKMVVEIPLYLVTHHRRIANLYKKWLRYLEGEISIRHVYRYEATLVRAEFNAIYCERDMRISKAMLLNKEKELEKRFEFPPIYFPDSPRGVAYNRYPFYNDWLLDFWHPLEKAIYPEYFTKRELRKQQYLEMWEKMHGPPKPQNF